MILAHIFSVLEFEDLARAATVCCDWWKPISRGAYLKEAELYKMNLSGSEDVFRFVPVKMFASLTHLKISSTNISNQHFQQLNRTAENLEFLDISNCPGLEESRFFK